MHYSYEFKMEGITIAFGVQYKLTHIGYRIKVVR